MVEKVAQHRHCVNCDKAISYKDKYCDEKCETDHKNRLQKKKRELVYFYGLMVAIFILAMVFLYMGRSG